ncbi:MAG: leucyl aminopeptidase family protein [Marmoricola sp.]|nr:leucyl aminopeptidase family protein [Marmoricola sp.]
MSLPPQVSPPEFTLSDTAPSQLAGVGVVAVPVLAATDPGSGPTLGPGAAELAEDLGLDLFDVLADDEEAGKPGRICELPVSGNGSSPSRVLLVGVGRGSREDLRSAGATLARRTLNVESVASSVAAVGDAEAMAAFVEGATLGSFSFSLHRDGPQDRPVRSILLALSGQDEETTSRLDQAVAAAWASWWARFLASVPSNIKSPAWLADQAVDAAEQAGLSAKVLDEQQLADRGFGGIVGVGQAAAAPPRLVELTYKPATRARSAPHVVLVGKGITFDSGGLSIKPAASMLTMKRDMTGAAVVAAVLAALPALGCRLRVTGLLPLAENAVGGRAMRPGDVITHYGGRTTEVTNTDAEGRLVLADGLAYAVKDLKADVLVDVATLTGAVKVALGQHLAGMFTNNDALAGHLERAGADSGEPVWRLPLSEEYESKLSSRIADSDNAPGGPGAITAALFLQHFIGDRPWVHLDIASVGDAPEDSFEWTEGPTGFGARLLLDWLCSEDPLAGVTR